MKRIILISLGILCISKVFGQEKLWTTYNNILTTEQNIIYNNIQLRPTTEISTLIFINNNVFKNQNILIPLANNSVILNYYDIGHTGITLESWIGQSADHLGNASFVIHDGRVSGKLNLLEGNYEICPLGSNGVHVLIKLNDNFKKCGNDRKVITPDRPDEIHIHESIPEPPKKTRTIGAECFIRLLIPYTANAKIQTLASYGRTMIEHISLAVLETNTGYAASNVSQRMELAYMYQTPTAESTSSTSTTDDKNDLRNTSDSRFVEVHALRDLYHADMVGLVAAGYSNIGLCGEAYAFNYTDPTNMFMVADFSCVTGNYTFAHEFAHTQGCRHQNDPNTVPFSYGHGKCNASYRTIMGTAGCGGTRLNIWSNPNINDPNGAPLGTIGSAENYRALNDGQNIVLQHRLTPANMTIPNTTILTDHYLSEYATNTITTNNLLVKTNSTALLRAGSEVNLLPGFEAEANSNFRAYIYSSCSNTGSVLYLKCFIQGYWDGANGMQSVLMNQGQPNIAGHCDSVIVELRDASTFALVASSTSIIWEDGGPEDFIFPLLTGSYYIVVKHRNALETWSAMPVSFGSGTITYDFTTSASQAFGSNQVEVAPGIWALYSGDVAKDVSESIELSDYALIEIDSDNFAFGYLATDINGDGNVDILDLAAVENNINNFIYAQHP